MDIHKNARLTFHSRGDLVRRVLVEGQTPRFVPERSFAVPHVPIMPPSSRRMAIVAERGLPPMAWSGQELTALGSQGSLRGG